MLQADSSPLPTLMGEDQGDQVPQSLPPPPALLKDLPASSETALSVNPRVLDPGLTSSTDQDVTPYGPSPRYSTINTPASNASYGASEISTPRCLSGHPKFLTTQVKYLLNHYRDHVLPFFSVLDNAYTPWRVLHFPKVLQAACETEIAGPPEGPSNVLLYAILTISAYSLQNSEMKRTSLDSSNHWEDTATQYKGQALKLLKIHVGTQSRDRIDSEYEELVAAMLSMVTIDVSGLEDIKSCDGMLTFFPRSCAVTPGPAKYTYKPAKRSSDLRSKYVAGICHPCRRRCTRPSFIFGRCSRQQR